MFFVYDMQIAIKWSMVFTYILQFIGKYIFVIAYAL